MTLPFESEKVKPQFDRLNPYGAPMVECRRLTKIGSSKEILHIVCDLSNSDIVYEVGSSFAILPENGDLYVDEVIRALGSPYRNFLVTLKTGLQVTFGEFLTKHANLSQVTSKHFHLMQKYHPTTLVQELLDDIPKLKEFCGENNLATFLAAFWHPSIPLQELVDTISPMMPRYYSVASSMKMVGNFAHFMVACFSYMDAGREKESITANYLKTSPIGTPIRLFLQHNHNFTLPEDSSIPIIMIGPGTGLASLRGFLQERWALGARGANWLFTGDRQRAFDFHYEEEMTSYSESGFLKLDAAFSRDSSEKIYVQDLMLKESAELWNWIKNKNAHIYICGDAKHMAKDVQKTLHLIAESEGQLSPEEAKAFFKQMRHEKRLLLDIY
jgi:sulfite reductase (NADPH) flavoprotein alpha-component